MPMDLPPNPPAIYAPAPTPECRYLNAAEADVAFKRLRASLPSTSFERATPSEICGLVRVQMSNGKAGYTDATGRYFLLAFAMDTHKGGPADNAEQLSQQLGDRDKFPQEAIPGVMPRGAPVTGPLMSPIAPPQVNKSISSQ